MGMRKTKTWGHWSGHGIAVWAGTDSTGWNVHLLWHKEIRKVGVRLCALFILNGKPKYKSLSYTHKITTPMIQQLCFLPFFKTSLQIQCKKTYWSRKSGSGSTCEGQSVMLIEASAQWTLGLTNVEEATSRTPHTRLEEVHANLCLTWYESNQVVFMANLLDGGSLMLHRCHTEHRNAAAAVVKGRPYQLINLPASY